MSRNQSDFQPKTPSSALSIGGQPVASHKWLGADQEARNNKYSSSVPCGGDARAAGTPRSAPIRSLDRSHIRCPAPGPQGEIDGAAPQLVDGEWFVRQKTIDGYTEIFAIDDPEKDFARRRSAATSDKDYVSASAKKKVVERPRIEPDEFEIIARREKAVRRSRKNLMWAVRGLGGNRIFTLTKRGRIGSMREAWALWGKFERMASMRFKGFQTIVVIEPHILEGFHIHFVANRFFDVSSMRLWWHRILTGERLQTIRRGDMSPGNIDVDPPHSGEKIAKYLGKYLGKSFREITGRIKRYACSKGIRKPTIEPSRLPRSLGAEVFHLRAILESQGFTRGWRVFETMVMGRRFIWMGANKRM